MELSLNWIDNSLIVRGDGFTKFWKASAGPNGLLDFEKLCPVSKSRVRVRKGPDSEQAAAILVLHDQRTLREKTWGTACLARHVIKQDRRWVTFQTAWDPPIELFDQVTQQFPHLIFELEALDRTFKKAWSYMWAGGRRLKEDEGGSEDFRFPWAVEDLDGTDR